MSNEELEAVTGAAIGGTGITFVLLGAWLVGGITGLGCGLLALGFALVYCAWGPP